MELLALDCILVNGGCHKHVNVTVTVCLHSLFKGLECCLAGLGTAAAEFNVQFVVVAVYDVELAGLGIGSLFNGIVWNFHLQGFTMIGRSLGRPEYYGGAYVEHLGILECLEDYFVTDTVDVALCYSYTYFSSFAHIVIRSCLKS